MMAVRLPCRLLEVMDDRTPRHRRIRNIQDDDVVARAACAKLEDRPPYFCARFDSFPLKTRENSLRMFFVDVDEEDAWGARV